MNINTSSAVWTALGWTFLHVGWIGVIVGLGASLVRRSLRRAPAEVRHAAALVSLLSLAASPFIAFAVVYEPAHAPISPPTATIVQHEARPQPVAAVVNERPPIRPEFPTERTIASRWFEPWIDVLPGVWLAGTLMILVRTTIGLVGIERLRRSAEPLREGPIAERCRELARSLGVAREVGLAVCDRIAGPLLIGVIRPTILLPAAALSGWAPDQLEMALLHELAHLRRRDNLVCLFQKLVEALLFFHPTTWWLSAWLRLERETCCDQRVVARTGRPRAYAELLATLAGAGRTSPPCPAMTERPIATRIRRILFKEDRPMPLKPTVPETLALAAATLLAAALTLPSRAEAPKPKADVQSSLTLLERLAVRAAEDGDSVTRNDSLIRIAEAQYQLGARDAARATLARASLPVPRGKDSPVDRAAVHEFYRSMRLAQARTKIGDPDGAREVLNRASALLGPLNTGEVRRLLTATEEEMQEEKQRKANGHEVDDRVERASIEKQATVPRPVDASELLGLRIQAIEDRIDADDSAGALRELGVIDEVVGTMDSLSATMMDIWLARLRVAAGDVAGGRAAIDRFREGLTKHPLPPGQDASAGWGLAAEALAQSGDFEGALGLLESSTPAAFESGADQILCSLQKPEGPSMLHWLDPVGAPPVKADPAATFTDPARARTVITRIVEVVRKVNDVKCRARVLATAAHFQAALGDTSAALASADAMPDLRRADHPGVVDGRDDSLRPITYAIIAAYQASAGEPSSAATFAKARAAVDAAADADERLMASLVVAQKLAKHAPKAEATEFATRAIAFAASRPEPQRSRALCMLAEFQLDAGDVDGSLKTAGLIRTFPGIERATALENVSDRKRRDGDIAAARVIAAQAAAFLTTVVPSDYKPGKTSRVNSSGLNRESFVDFDVEIHLGILEAKRQELRTVLRTKAGELDVLLREARALPPSPRDAFLTRLLPPLIREGRIDEAFALADSMGSPDRSYAYRCLAGIIAADATSR